MLWCLSLLLSITNVFLSPYLLCRGFPIVFTTFIVQIMCIEKWMFIQSNTHPSEYGIILIVVWYDSSICICHLHSCHSLDVNGWLLDVGIRDWGAIRLGCPMCFLKIVLMLRTRAMNARCILLTTVSGSSDEAQCVDWCLCHCDWSGAVCGVPPIE